MAKGVCKLTGHSGKFVDSHILPKALTRHAQKGEGFIQAGAGTRPERRFSSWYDNRLVTAEGEAILSKIDDWAISALREHKLVWSGWGPIQSISNLVAEKIPDTKWGIRFIHGLDARRLRLFFLSLLWRAAASDRWEMSQVSLPQEDLETLRIKVLTSDPEPISFYPVRILQLSTVGPTHNYSPIKLTGEHRHSGSGIFRFYFEGLMAHVAINRNETGAKQVGSLALGSEDRIIVPAVPYESSLQSDLVRDTVLNAVDLFGPRMP
ncbi:hypothetical protein [Pseudorhodoplanes sp.]|uniref:hypothetical protein n=1 Tax=Pseudorhodoplanes sp. TaxID=1934341 RepID=UPI002B5CCB62|nr:hypothetical protein [Pseudorhodoplanes sp.]HWV51144.1 hypothetical protein [Pseudorhodoplanes sp.]